MVWEKRLSEISRRAIRQSRNEQMPQVGWGKNMNDKTDNETKKEAVENAAEALDEIAKSKRIAERKTRCRKSQGWLSTSSLENE